ncbi:MAG: ferritin-like domain-containing protein [Polaromonas sp.]|nr:ferritin-like domain-containing protein [Gemmatimonadaceae bacterium]
MDEGARDCLGLDVAVGNGRALHAVASRRDFMRLIGMGGALVLLPSLLAGCEDGSNTGGLTGPGTGAAVTIDFALGDVAVLQLAYALEQLEADFYGRVVANFASSGFSTAEQATLSHIHNHERIHRDFLKATLGTSAGFTLATVYDGVDFGNRISVLKAARTLEDTGVAAYNGASQYLTLAGNLLVAAKIVSVEARHASVIRDMISPLSNEFAPSAFDDVDRPKTVATAAQAYLVNKLVFANEPTAFTPGPADKG